MSNIPRTHIATTGDVDVNELVPFFGVCCFITSCYTDYPACLGAGCENTVLCCKNKIIMCKPSMEDDAYCKCCLTDCDIIPCEVCLKSRTQFFCIDLRASLPPSEEIPCLFTVCFLTCIYKYTCACGACSSINDISGGEANTKDAGAAGHQHPTSVVAKNSGTGRL